MTQPTYCLLTELSYTASRSGGQSDDPAATGGKSALGRGRRSRRGVNRIAMVKPRRNRSEFHYARSAGCRG